MTLPFVIENTEHRLSSILIELLSQTEGRPFDAVRADFPPASERRFGRWRNSGMGGNVGGGRLHRV